MQTAQQQQRIQEQVQRSIQDAQAAQAAARDADQQARDNGTVIRLGPGLPGQPGTPRGITIERGFPRDNDIPPRAQELAMGFLFACTVVAIGLPLARAFARRIDRRPTDATPANPQLTDQLQRIEQAVDAMAIEIERISESQRFIAKLQNQNADRASLPADRG